jgi:hypothetical protein
VIGWQNGPRLRSTQNTKRGYPGGVDTSEMKGPTASAIAAGIAPASASVELQLNETEKWMMKIRAMDKQRSFVRRVAVLVAVFATLVAPPISGADSAAFASARSAALDPGFYPATGNPHFGNRFYPLTRAGAGQAQSAVERCPARNFCTIQINRQSAPAQYQVVELGSNDGGCVFWNLHQVSGTFHVKNALPSEVKFYNSSKRITYRLASGRYMILDWDPYYHIMTCG